MKDIWTPHPLTRTRRDDGAAYHREPSVEAEIRGLCALKPRMRQASLVRGGEGRVKEETLVWAIRECVREGDTETAWKLAELLTERVSGHISRQLGKWRLGAEDAEDCTRDLFARLFDALFDIEPSGEFWEVRFWVCLDRRLWNLVERRQGALDVQLREAEAPEGSESGETESLLARLTDPNPGPEALAERASALAVLTETERLAVYMKYVEGLPEESDDPERVTAARILGVTGRSVRNYLRRAEEKLKLWQQT